MQKISVLADEKPICGIFNFEPELKESLIRPLMSRDVSEFQDLVRCTCEQFIGMSIDERTLFSMRRHVNKLVYEFLTSRGYKLEFCTDRRGKESLRALDARTEAAAAQLETSFTE